MGKRCIDPSPSGTGGGPHRLCGVPGLAARAVVVGRLSEVSLVIEDQFDERRKAEGKAEFDLRFSRQTLGDPVDRAAKAAGGPGDG